MVVSICSRSPGSHRIHPQTIGVESSFQNLDLELDYPGSNAQTGILQLCDLEKITAQTLSFLICKMELVVVPPSCGGCKYEMSQYT